MTGVRGHRLAEFDPAENLHFSQRTREMGHPDFVNFQEGKKWLLEAIRRLLADQEV
jgi:hypothetical protein